MTLARYFGLITGAYEVSKVNCETVRKLGTSTDRVRSSIFFTPRAQARVPLEQIHVAAYET